MGNGLVETLEEGTTHTPIHDSVDSVHTKNRIGQISRTIATFSNFVVIPFGYGVVPDTVIVDFKQRAADAKARLQNYAESTTSLLSNLMDRKDRYAERLAASRRLRKSGYVLKGGEIYYPLEIRVNGVTTSRTEELVGKLIFDGRYNRAEILWEHCPILERKLKDSGYISVAPSDKI